MATHVAAHPDVGRRLRIGGRGSTPDPTRGAAVVTGVLFIIATLADLVAAALRPALTGTDYLTQVSGHANEVATASFFYLIAAFACAGIAISLYPVLKRTGPGLAVGAVVFRALEAAMYLVAIVSLLSLATLGQRFTETGAAARSSVQTIGDVLVSVRDHASLLGVFAFCLGAFIYYCLFYRSRLIPRWLSGWGIAAIILGTAGCVLALFADKPTTDYAPLFLPIAVQEMVLAVWLIAKGFSAPGADVDA